MDVVSLTRRLVAFDTVSARSNAACISFLRETVEALGFTTQLHDCSSPGGPSKLNLIARRGGGPGGLLLAGHSDTVPFRPDQRATLSAFQEGGALWGRGTCDMKGAIAAQLVAAEATADLGLRRPLTLAFTCDEEIGCLGAKRLLTAGLIQARHAIVGEPTSLKPVRMHKGYVGLKVDLLGVAAHSSDPSRGRSAIRGAGRVLLALEALEEALATRGYQAQPGAFKPDRCTVNVGLIEGGVARNVIAERCSFTVELRPLPGQAPADLVAEVEARVQQAVTPLGLGFELSAPTRDPAMETPADAEVLAFLRERSGAEAGAVAFSTEGKEYNQMGLETAIFGPGSIDLAHQEDERVPLDELEAAVEHYRAAILHFCQ